MFTIEELRALLDARPFVPFRVHLTDGGSIDIRYRDQVFLTRRLAIIGIPGPSTEEALVDSFTIVAYMHISQAELLEAGSSTVVTS
jgi:hypothetical protein